MGWCAIVCVEDKYLSCVFQSMSGGSIMRRSVRLLSKVFDQKYKIRSRSKGPAFANKQQCQSHNFQTNKLQTDGWNDRCFMHSNNYRDYYI